MSDKRFEKWWSEYKLRFNPSFYPTEEMVKEAWHESARASTGILFQVADRLKELTGEQNVWKAIDKLHESRRQAIEDVAERIEKAILLIKNYGGIDGGHHKQWVLDQVIKALVDDYNKWITEYEDGEDGTKTYKWDVGIAP